MTESVEVADVKVRHRSMWASGDYPTVARQLIPHLGQRLVEAVRVEAGMRVLDVGAGSGNAAIAAAERGADVVAVDLTPELFAAGRAEAAARGVELTWEEGDAEALPYDDGSFDAVVSCVGVMFAPYHQAAADELVRVIRPGGAIGLLSWTPGGFIGQMFAAMKPYAPPPPPGASPPPLWGAEEHLGELFGDHVSGLTSSKESVSISGFTSGAAFRDFFKSSYGPTIAAYAALAEQPERSAALDVVLAELADDHIEDGVMGWEYLLTTATRAR
ncbi:class I SAM-dependent methyltransferase [Nocardioides sp.]|jgi:SAM-dependent methyltransferase|uniref:class I SAM-dependent methyltransferase n=1 Tax=Nocardioides sp. TaxID=35761 RepID=UPI0026169FED|nr:class I SAM-dependent methyltransferase [Nocardioides sp.]